MNQSEIPDASPTAKRPVVTFAAFAIVLLFQLFAALPAMKAPGTLMDEGILLTYPELLTKGSIPHRDYESMYPPGSIWLLSGAYAVCGTDIEVERAVGLLYQIALASAFVALLLRWSASVAVAGGVLCVIALLPLNLVAFAWVGASAFAVWSLVAISSSLRTELRASLAGALAAMALTFRVDLAPAVLLSLGAYCLLARWRVRELRWMIGAAGVAFIPLLVHIALVSPTVFFASVFSKPVLTCSRGRTLPLDFSRAFVGQLYAVLLVSIGLAILAGWRAYRSQRVGGLALFVTGMFSLGALPQALMRSDITHLSFITPLALPLVAASACILFGSRLFAPLMAVASVCALLPQSTMMLKQRLTSRSFPKDEVFVLHSGDRMFPVGNVIYAKASQDVIKRITELSKPGETLFVGPSDLRFAMGNDLFLYHMLPWLKPHTYFLEMNPLSANKTGSRLADDVASCDWLILNSVWNSIAEPNASRVAGPAAPNDVVTQQFDMVCEKAPFFIYKHRGLVTQVPDGE